jgi:3-oxoacyl-(acyl-carrier-protein) synthase
MPRRVVVTGIGMVTPGGMHPGPLWERLCQGSPGGAAIRRFDATPFTVSEAGEVDEDLPLPLPPRLLKRMDRYCVLALAAAQLALDDSALDVATEDPDGVGISIGNMYGGWGITDPSLRGLLQEGYASVSPYVASAWFPTAPQGQMSIFWGLRGYAKTIAADTASGAAAIGYAARAIQDGHADVMLAGGAEAPVTPYAYAFCQVSGRMGDAYRPFDRRADGFRVGEGAAILVLEEEERAAARGARTYGEVAGWSTGHVGGPEPWPDGDRRLAEVVEEALGEAGIAASSLDYVGLDAQGDRRADRAEAAALAGAGGNGLRAVCTTCKPGLTNLLGAAASAETAVALLAMQRGEVPPIAGCDEPESGVELDLVTGRCRTAPLRNALVVARGADGVRGALVLKGSPAAGNNRTGGAEEVRTGARTRKGARDEGSRTPGERGAVPGRGCRR